MKLNKVILLSVTLLSLSFTPGAFVKPAHAVARLTPKCASMDQSLEYYNNQADYWSAQYNADAADDNYSAEATDLNNESWDVNQSQTVSQEMTAAHCGG